jgi:NitT/TauT family transport system permease protein
MACIAEIGKPLWARLWRAVLLPGGILVIWVAVTDGGLVPAYLMPSPAAVFAAGLDFVFGHAENPYSGTFLPDFRASLTRVLAGFAAGSSLGMPLGIALGYSQRLAAYVEPTLQATRAIPGICWLPLALIWFGIGTPSAVFLIALGSFYAVFLSAMQGTKYVDPILLRAGRCLGASEFAVLVTIILPAAFPAILSGLRIGLAYSWIYMVLGEYTGVNLGLGATLLQSRETLNTDLVIALMIIIGLLGILSDGAMLLVMRKLLRMDVR